METVKVNNGEKVKVVKQNPAPVVVKIPVSEIRADGEFNVRQTENEDSKRDFEDLKHDMSKNGQLSPVEVRPDPKGGYILTYGYRRFRAAQELGWSGIDAQVVSVDDRSAFIRNMSENVIRENLHPYDIGVRWRWMRDKFGMTGAEIGAATGGKTKGHVNSLIACVEKLHPKIIEKWKANHAGATLPNLMRMAREDKEKQLETWDEILGITASEIQDEIEEGETAKKGTKKKTKPSETILKRALAAVKTAGVSEVQKAAVTASLKFALGITSKLTLGDKVVFDRLAKPSKSDDSDA